MKNKKKKIDFMFIGICWHIGAIVLFLLSIALRLMPTGLIRLYILLGIIGISLLLTLAWYIQLKLDSGSKKIDN